MVPIAQKGLEALWLGEPTVVLDRLRHARKLRCRGHVNDEDSPGFERSGRLVNVIPR